MTLRLGLIGAGPWGRRYIETLRDFPGAVLTRVASRNHATAAFVGPACKVTPDWRRLIGASDLDGLIIASPPAFHAEHAGFAIASGMPVLIEKPLTLDLHSSLCLLEAAQLRGTVVLVDHLYLFHPAYEELKRRVLLLGGRMSIRSIGGNRGPVRPSVPPLWDYGPHDLSMCLDLAGRMPSSIKGARRRSGEGEIIDLHLAFPGGTEAHLTFGNGFEAKARNLTVLRGGVELRFNDLGEVMLVESASGRPGVPVAVEAGRPLDRALRAFLIAIRARPYDLTELRSAVEVVALLSQCETVLARGGGA